MPPAVGIGIAAGGALLGAYGQRRAAQKQNAYLSQAAGMLSPEQINERARQIDPYIFNALNAQAPQTPTTGFRTMGDYMDWLTGVGRDPSYQGYQGNLNLMAQMPGYIDPTLMNYGLTNANVQGANRAQGFASNVGRSGMQGGLADLYDFANQAATGRERAGIVQGYDFDRANRARQDISYIGQRHQGAIDRAASHAGSAAGYMAQRQPAPNWAQIGSQAISTGLQGYGALRSPQQQQPQTPSYYNQYTPFGPQQGMQLPTGGYIPWTPGG